MENDGFSSGTHLMEESPLGNPKNRSLCWPMWRCHDHQRLVAVHVNYRRSFRIIGFALSQFAVRGSFSFQIEHVVTSNNWYSPSRSVIRTAWLTTNTAVVVGYVSANDVAHHSSGKFIADLNPIPWSVWQQIYWIGDAGGCFRYLLLDSPRWFLH